MKILVVFYSRTGNTEKVGKEIAKNLKSDRDKIVDLTGRKGVINFIKSGYHAIKNKTTKIRYSKKPEKYDLVVVGGPVWAGRVSPAVRTYISENKFKKIAFFCSCENKNSVCFKEMEKLTKKPVAVLEITEKEIKGNSYRKKTREFSKSIKTKI
jgi:flavodoxin